MLSSKKIVCPTNLINIAKKIGCMDAAIVNAGEIFPMESVHKAVQHNLINPLFIGNENKIKELNNDDVVLVKASHAMELNRMIKSLLDGIISP